MRRIHAWIIAAFAFAQIAEGRAPRRKVDSPLPIMFGNASWYGSFFDGRLTASGVRFHAMLDSAASVTLPLGTWIKVTNLENGRFVVVQVTDRGPYVKNRILDVSLATARKLGMVASGVVRVSIEPVPTPDR